MRNPRSSAPLKYALCCFVLVGCAGSHRSPAEPLSAEALRVQVLTAEKPGCKKLGSVRGTGRNLSEPASDTEALNAAREQAVKLSANALLVTDTNKDREDGSGGTYWVITKSVNVFSCTP